MSIASSYVCATAAEKLSGRKNASGKQYIFTIFVLQPLLYFQKFVLEKLNSYSNHNWHVE
jgi:hypothetical protein